MRAQRHASPDDIDITSLWGSIKTSLPRLAIASMLAGALTFAVLSLMAPRYVSEARLAIVAKGANDPFKDPRTEGSNPESVAVRMDKEAVNTHLQALQSPDLGAKIADEMKLAERPEFNNAAGSPDKLSAILRLAGIGGPKAGESEQDRVLSNYFKQLEAYAPKESRSIVVRFTSIDAQLAADVANKIADSYRAKLATQTVSESDDVTKALEPKITKLKDEVAASEAEIERFRGEANIFKGGQGSTGLNEQQLAELTAELSKAKGARSDIETRAKSAREMMKSGSADILPDVQKSPLILSLVQQRVRLERQVSELSATLLPGHPRMHQINADLAGLKRQITAEITKVVDSLEKEAKVAALREESINKSLSEIKARVVTTGPDEVKLRNLEASAKAKRGELDSLQAQYESARARSDSRAVPVEAQVITKARASSIPVFPKKGPYALLASLAIGLFGLAWTITRSLLTGARPAARPVARDIRLPDPVPPAPKGLRNEPVAAASAEPTLSDRVVRIANIAALAGHLESHIPASGACRSIVVGDASSLDPGPEAVELAKELATRGHAVIVVDWSPDSSGLAQGLGLARTPGMTELFEGAAKFEDVVQRLPNSSAHFIASGSAMSYAAEGPEADQINLILDALDEAYAHIIVAGPYEAARNLFEVIEGRFDCGVTIVDAKRRVSVIQDPPGTFLGYEVSDMEIVRYERKDGAVPMQRILRATGAKREEAHPA